MINDRFSDLQAILIRVESAPTGYRFPFLTGFLKPIVRNSAYL
jgi:hypothetical protein